MRFIMLLWGLAGSAFAGGAEASSEAGSTEAEASSSSEAGSTEAESSSSSEAGSTEAEASSSSSEAGSTEASSSSSSSSEESAPIEPAPRWPGQVTPDSPHYDLEVLFHEERFTEGLEIAKRRWAEAPDDDLPWMIVRFMFSVGEVRERDDPDMDKLAWYQEMLEWCERGLALAPGDPQLLFARGVARGRLGTTRGILASLFMAQDIEQDWLAAAESGYVYSSIGGEVRMPCDAYLALGMFYRMVPDWWIVQALAGTRGDLDRSEAWLVKADACMPDKIEILKELGATRICAGTRRGEAGTVEQGREALQRLLALPPANDIDEVDHAHARRLLEDPSLACGYSRDGHQELDRASVGDGP